MINDAHIEARDELGYCIAELAETAVIKAFGDLTEHQDELVHARHALGRREGRNSLNEVVGT